MPYSEKAVPYLESLLDRQYYWPSVAEVEAAIHERGYWSDLVEWRLMTDTGFRIEPDDWQGKPFFKVTVSCESEMVCHCPTIERAITYAIVFFRVQADLFWTMGWPSRPGPNSLAEIDELTRRKSQ
jgi:hypothetical protein